MPLTPEIQQALDKLVSEIVRLAHPEEIILFGSAARDDVSEPNDLDLSVVMPEGTQKIQMMRHIYENIELRIGFPFDILVSSKCELQKYKNSIGLIYKDIIKEGVIIYAGQICY